MSAEVDIQASTLMAFPTPIVNHLWPDAGDLNQQLLSWIGECRQQHAGLARSNVGGWHSDIDFLSQSDCPAVVSLARRLRAFVFELNRTVMRPDHRDRADDFQLEGWANVLERGEYNSLHCHPNAFWSGVYYVNGNPEVEDHPMSGKLELIDPRPGASLTYVDTTALYGRFLLSPQAGQMLLFPAWLQHLVHPNFSSTPRVSIAFNVLMS